MPASSHGRGCSAVSRISLLFLVLSAALWGCGDRPLGTGVVLWSPDESLLRSASVVSVLSQSEITDTYRVSADELAEPLDIERWRVELHDDADRARTRASEFASALEGNPSLHARATRSALPVRSEPRAAAGNTIYRLRENEEVKLIGRQPEETDLEGLVSYWYEAMTATGERGWVFGYTLRLFDPTDDTVVVETGRGADPLIDLLLQNVWRPVYYLDMIASRAFDLELFRPEFGLFPQPENRQLELVLPYHATIFEYEQIAPAGSRRYVAEGTSLQITFQRNDELNLRYTLEGRQYILAMQRVPGDIEQFIENEIERRSAVYERLLERGPELGSDAYGSLTLMPNQQFAWTGFQRLVPTAISPQALSTGRIDMGLYLSSALRRDYDGALAFRFDGEQTPASFVYQLLEGGIRFVWVAPQNIRDRIVQSVGVSPLTVFMSAVTE